MHGVLCWVFSSTTSLSSLWKGLWSHHRTSWSKGTSNIIKSSTSGIFISFGLQAWRWTLKPLNLLLSFSLNLSAWLATDFLATHSATISLSSAKSMPQEFRIWYIQDPNQSKRYTFPTMIRLNKIWSPFRPSVSRILLTVFLKWYWCQLQCNINLHHFSPEVISL